MTKHNIKFDLQDFATIQPEVDTVLNCAKEIGGVINTHFDLINTMMTSQRVNAMNNTQRHALMIAIMAYTWEHIVAPIAAAFAHHMPKPITVMMTQRMLVHYCNLTVQHMACKGLSSWPDIGIDLKIDVHTTHKDFPIALEHYNLVRDALGEALIAHHAGNNALDELYDLLKLDPEQQVKPNVVQMQDFKEKRNGSETKPTDGE